MKCWRIDLRRKFSLYVTGELEASAVKRVEDHLLDCGSCRTRLVRLRNGHRFAQEMPRFTPQRDPWTTIEASIDAQQPIPIPNAWAAKSWRKLVLKPGFALAVIGVLALIAAVIVASSRRSLGEERAGSLIADALDFSEFKTVNIADIEQNRKPHVMAEGYVSEVRVNDEDGDLTFKLVDELGRPGPFIICEIIDPIKLAPPSVGSRVRVYGVSRYDGQADHNWYEVHPVLNIEVVRR
jgi:anti-sigma factor RsiW